MLEVLDPDHLLDRGQTGDDGGHVLTTVVGAPSIVVAVGEQHDLGGQLGEAGQNGLRPELRGAHRPDRPDAGAREQADDGLGPIGQHRHDPVPMAHTHRPHGGGQGSDLAAQLTP